MSMISHSIGVDTHVEHSEKKRFAMKTGTIDILDIESPGVQFEVQNILSNILPRVDFHPPMGHERPVQRKLYCFLSLEFLRL